MSAVADPMGAPYFRIFSPAAMRRPASLWPIGRSEASVTRAAPISIASPAARARATRMLSDGSIWRSRGRWLSWW
jgi:hypothetical protein